LSIRIYALAKELKLDSKILMDQCVKAGITGKGSALATLTEEEAVKLKEYVLAGGAASPAAPQRPPAPARPVTARPPQVPPPAPAPVRPAPAPPAFSRGDYVSPAGTSGKPPVLPAPKAEKPPIEIKRKPPAETGPRPPVKAAPAIKLAPMPATAQPVAPPKPAEPTPQKPDIKLPADAIRATRAGKTPLGVHLKKAEEKRKQAETQKKTESGRPAPAAATPPPMPVGGGVRDRARRQGKTAAEDEATPATPAKDQRRPKRAKTDTGRRRGDEDDGSSRSGQKALRRIGTNTAAPRKGNVVVDLPCTVRSFSEAIGVPAQKVLAKLMALGNLLNINAALGDDLAELLAHELAIVVDFKRPVDLERELLAEGDEVADPPESLRPRAPVVTFLGHVDHGKTSLLDRIIGIDVASGESGGITQHIRAYRIERDGKSIAFVDTPGHEAFTEMRARGANVTDIAVLVVAADDGVMPQTEEAISHAKAAEVPIVVALNKIDLPGVDTNRIFQQLATAGLLPTEWGGETEVIRTSAIKGTGIDELLETLLTLAELQELKANPERPASGTCLEAELHEGRGVVAKLLVQKGTLHVGDVLVCGTGYGRVKAMYDTLEPRKTHDAVGPSVPVNVTGLAEAPAAGDHFHVLPEIAQARQIAEERAVTVRRTALSGGPQKVTLENLFDRLGAQTLKHLNIILRADVRGSIEAIQKELTKLDHPEVQIRILQATIGGITEADVHLAAASEAIIIGFNVVPDEGARLLAEAKGVQIRRYDIIYQVTADLKAALEGMLKPEERTIELGRALVQKVFTISRVGNIAGCRMLSGTVVRSCRVRVIRENRVIGDYPLDSLRREKDDVREIREGQECGMKLSGFNDLKEGDVLETYKTEEFARTL
jgi:translation initiation factor IF-2